MSEESVVQVARKGDWMQTFSGIQFWPLDPRAEEINIDDIAHSLALQCRFAGHCTRFYSVAQHSVMVSDILPPEYRAWGLLHDASEAYLVDLPRPVKRYSAIGAAYKPVEEWLECVIAERFGLPWPMPACVKEADDILLMTEKRDLMPNSPAKWRELAIPLPEVIEPWSSDESEVEFLERAATLGLCRMYAVRT